MKETMDNKNKIKILITQDCNPLKGTGISVATYGVAKELAKLDFEVTFATYDVPNKLVKDPGSGVNIVKLNTIQDLTQKIKGSDVVIPVVSFSSVFKAFGTTVSKICENEHKPYMPWVHTSLQNSKFNNIYNIKDYVQETSIFLMAEMFKSPFCKKILAVSEAVRDSVVSLSVPPNKVEVILNGLDLVKIGKELETPIQKTNDVICIQRLHPEKGSPLTIAVFANLKKLIPDFKAIVVGDGEDIDMVQSLIKMFGLTKNITTIPTVINGELIKLIQKSKVFLSTSLTESFGLAIAESMYIGTPVVAPNIEGPKELLENGLNGFVFDSGDTLTPAKIIAGILNNEIVTVEKTKNAVQKIEHDCDITIQSEKLARLIKKTLT